MVKVLLIEDSADDAFLVRAQLCPDYKVRTVTTFRQAIEVLDFGEKFNLVLLDLGLPDLKGDRTIVEAIRKLQQYAPVTVLSGSENLGLTAQIRKTGTPFLSKEDALTGRELSEFIAHHTSQLEMHFEALRQEVERLLQKDLPLRLALVEDNLGDTRREVQRIETRFQALEKEKSDSRLEFNKVLWGLATAIALTVIGAFLNKWVDRAYQGNDGSDRVPKNSGQNVHN